MVVSVGVGVLVSGEDTIQCHPRRRRRPHIGGGGQMEPREPPSSNIAGIK